MLHRRWKFLQSLFPLFVALLVATFMAPSARAIYGGTASSDLGGQVEIWGEVNGVYAYACMGTLIGPNGC